MSGTESEEVQQEVEVLRLEVQVRGREERGREEQLKEVEDEVRAVLKEQTSLLIRPQSLVVESGPVPRDDPPPSQMYGAVGSSWCPDRGCESRSSPDIRPRRTSGGNRS